MKKRVFILLLAVMGSILSARTWRKEGGTLEAGFCDIQHIVVYNDSRSQFFANSKVVNPGEVEELEDTVICLTKLREYALRIYYDLYPRDKKIVIHVADDKGLREE